MYVIAVTLANPMPGACHLIASEELIIILTKLSH